MNKACPTSQPSLDEHAPVVLLLIGVINVCALPGRRRCSVTRSPAAKRIAALKKRLQRQKVPPIDVNDNFGRWRSDSQRLVDRCTAECAAGASVARVLRPGVCIANDWLCCSYSGCAHLDRRGDRPERGRSYRMLLSNGQSHRALPLTVWLCPGIAGTLVAEALAPNARTRETIRIGRPSGTLAVGCGAQRGSFFRTAPRLFAGRLYLQLS
jgi:hypothetical protein